MRIIILNVWPHFYKQTYKKLNTLQRKVKQNFCQEDVGKKWKKKPIAHI